MAHLTDHAESKFGKTGNVCKNHQGSGVLCFMASQPKAMFHGLNTGLLTIVVVPLIRPAIKPLFLHGGTLHGSRLTGHECWFVFEKG